MHNIYNYLKGLKKRYGLNFHIPFYNNKFIWFFDIVSVPVIRRINKEFFNEKEAPLFRYIEIETINRCNGTCAFCGVNRNVDPRPKHTMSEAMFSSILQQLADVNYSGTIGLYSNNEPLLDKRIYSFAEEARRTVPNAKIVLYTNGTLLTVEKFKKLLPHLDELFVDDYSDDLVFHDNIREVAEYWDANKVDGKSISFVARSRNEVLSSRGGSAPNKKNKRTLRSSCLFPFMQIVVRPDGKLSLCCNDALGDHTLGDLNSESLLDAWKGVNYKKIRNLISRARANLPICSGCDDTSSLMQYIKSQ